MKHFLFKFSRNNPKIIIGLVTITTVFFALQFSKIKIDTDPENMLSPQEHVRQFHHEIKETFNLHDMLVLGIYDEKGVFNQNTIPRVIAITDEIKDLDGVIADDILSISEVDDITSDNGTIRVHPLVEGLPATKEEGLELKFAIERNPILSNKLAASDGKLIGIYIPIESKNLSFKLSKQIEEIARKHLGEEQYYIAGLPIAEDTFGAEMFKQMGISAPLAGLIIGLLLLFFFRKFIVVFAPMVLAVVTVIWTMGLLIGTGNTVHIMSSMIPIFLFPIAVLNSIHILSSFHERYQRHKHMKTTIMHTMDELFMPMLFTSLTTTVGFLSLALTPIPPVKVFGLFVSFGIATSWLLSMTFLPAYAMLLPKKTLKTFGISEEGDDSVMARILPKIQVWSTNRARGIVIGTLVLFAFSVVGISRIVVNDNPVNWFKKDHPLRQADAIMNSHMGGTYMSNLVFEGDEDTFKEPEVVAYMESVQNLINERKSVGATTSVVDVLKKIAYELKGTSELPDNYDEIAQYYFIYEMAGGDPEDLFTFITSDYSKAHIWVQMTEGDNILMNNLVHTVDDYISLHPLPEGVSAEWAGLNYINVVWQDKMVNGMLWSLLGSFLIVFFMMVILFRSLVWGLLSMIPLTTTITFIYALIGFAGKPYDMPVAVLSSLTLGLSIDFAIHFIKRAQFIHNQTNNFKETMNQMFEEPAKAITRNMMVIAIGFVPLFLANLVPYITVGVFFFIIMLFSGIATLIILPALSQILQGRLFPETEKSHTQRSKIMNKSVATVTTVLLAAAVSISGLFHAQKAAAESAQDIMKQSHLAYYYAADDGVAEVEMTLTSSKGKTRIRKFTMLRKDFEEGGEQRYFTYFKEPGDVRRMTFMVWKKADADDDRWIYIPALDLVKRIASNDKQSSFVGSDFTYEDVSGRHWNEDNHSLEREEALDGKETYVIKSTPKDSGSAVYDHRLSWIEKATYLPLKEEYYDKKGTLLRIFTANEFQTVDGILTITKRTMTDEKKGNNTVVSFSSIKYNTGIKDDIFTERYLRKPPREYIASN
ncbi:MAG: outer membrane lipoprotein-sorting protein [Candidatus Latescibacteria bacterium]|nr:outer membrane lipoprotein-sorting protein [Candidatus Latescibacterota bacterium]